MRDVVIVEAVRTPIGREAGLVDHPLGRSARRVQRQLIERAGIDPAGSARSSAAASARSACRPSTSPARRGSRPGSRSRSRRRPSTPSAARPSRRPTWPTAWSASGVVDVAVACGVEVDEPGAAGLEPRRGRRQGRAEGVLRALRVHVASSRGPSASPSSGASPATTPTRFGLQSQERAARPGPRAASTRRSCPIDAPDLDDDGKPTGTTHRVDRDEGLRETTLEGLAGLKPVGQRRRRPHRGHVVADLRRLPRPCS